MDKKWEILKKQKSGNIVTELLSLRGVISEEQQKEFFEPMHPLNIKLSDVGLNEIEIKKAKKRIQAAIKNNETIIVFGDYDADGITAAAILWETLYQVSAKVTPYIPDRFEEGYGISTETLSYLKTKHKKLGLIITVDTGIVAFEAAEKAKKLGIDLIITDHHEPDQKKPKVHALVHSTQISGSAVSWFLAREFADKNQAEDLLGLAALGTVADQLALKGVNRAIVKHGLESLKKTQRPGLLALCQNASVDPCDIDTYIINFILAPRINAMGRLEHAIDSLRLLCTKNQAQAKAQAELLEKTNLKRREIVDEALGHARQAAVSQKKNNIIVVSHEQYHEGVIGLIASKLSETYSLPAIVFSKGENISKASARSIPGFNLIQSIRKLDKFLLTGGGHEMAAGFSIDTANLEIFKSEIQKIANAQISQEMKLKKLVIDLELGFSDLDWNLAEMLDKFEPTGFGNFKPVFVTRSVKVSSFKQVGSEGKHLSLTFKKDDREYRGIAFGFGAAAEILKEGDVLDIAYNFEKNVWNGHENLQLKIRDLRPISL